MFLPGAPILQAYILEGTHPCFVWQYSLFLFSRFRPRQAPQQSSECSEKHAEAAAITCSGEGDSYKKVFEIASSCVKKKSLTNEQKQKLKGALADYKKNSDEIVKCEAFDEQGVSAGLLDAQRKDCRKLLEKKIETERCKPGVKSYMRYKFTAGSDERKNLMFLCKK
jgi:hypothetical protein